MLNLKVINSSIPLYFKVSFKASKLEGGKLTNALGNCLLSMQQN